MSYLKVAIYVRNKPNHWTALQLNTLDYENNIFWTTSLWSELVWDTVIALSYDIESVRQFNYHKNVSAEAYNQRPAIVKQNIHNTLVFLQAQGYGPGAKPN